MREPAGDASKTCGNEDPVKRLQFHSSVGSIANGTGEIWDPTQNDQAQSSLGGKIKATIDEEACEGDFGSSDELYNRSTDGITPSAVMGTLGMRESEEAACETCANQDPVKHVQAQSNDGRISNGNDVFLDSERNTTDTIKLSAVMGTVHPYPLILSLDAKPRQAVPVISVYNDIVAVVV